MYQAILDNIEGEMWALIDEMSLRDKIRDALQDRRATLSEAPTGETFINLEGKSYQVHPTDSIADIRARLQNPFESNRMSAIDRLKAKALQAKNVAPEAIRAFEADLDSLLAEKAGLDQKRAAAVAPHKEAIAGVMGEIDGLKSAIDILSND